MSDHGTEHLFTMNSKATREKQTIQKSSSSDKPISEPHFKLDQLLVISFQHDFTKRYLFFIFFVVCKNTEDNSR